MALDVVTLTNEIATLNLSGIRIFTLKELPGKLYEVDLPAFFPDIDIFYGPVQASQNSFKGSQNTALWTINRTFNYLYLHSVLGLGNGQADFAEPLATAYDNILTAFLTAEFSQCNLINLVMGNAAVIGSPNGPQYIGLEIGITVMEFINL